LVQGCTQIGTLHGHRTFYEWGGLAAAASLETRKTSTAGDSDNRGDSQERRTANGGHSSDHFTAKYYSRYAYDGCVTTMVGIIAAGFRGTPANIHRSTQDDSNADGMHDREVPRKTAGWHATTIDRSADIRTNQLHAAHRTTVSWLS
jgi:hypothetical protein